MSRRKLRDEDYESYHFLMPVMVVAAFVLIVNTWLLWTCWAVIGWGHAVLLLGVDALAAVLFGASIAVVSHFISRRWQERLK